MSKDYNIIKTTPRGYTCSDYVKITEMLNISDSENLKAAVNNLEIGEQIILIRLSNK